jgi:hypothetical protein
MKRTLLQSGWLFIATLLLSCVALAQREERGVRVVPNEAARRVEVFVDGKLFTSYIWPDSLKKPVLYPLLAATGTDITRGFPLNPRPGERVDHPHHVGLWFNHGDLNGVDFWNNSTGLSPERQKRMGTITHRRIASTKNGKDSGELVVEMDWIMPDGKVVLQETTKFIFYAGSQLRALDRITTLKAQADQVVFRDSKEGLFGLRVRRELEHPADKAEIFTDASGKATAVPKLDNTGVTGLYRSSEGKLGDAVWGTRATWTMLTGRIGDELITLAILDHPKNPGFPTYWHARGYGLFAANPLGAEQFTGGREKLNFTIKPDKEVTFRHRLMILSEGTAPGIVQTEFKRFAEGIRPL